MTIPPLINVFIALTKNTSVAGGFFVIELFAVDTRTRERQRRRRHRDPARRGDLLPPDHDPARRARGPTRARSGWCSDEQPSRPLRRARARRRGALSLISSIIAGVLDRRRARAGWSWTLAQPKESGGITLPGYVRPEPLGHLRRPRGVVVHHLRGRARHAARGRSSPPCSRSRSASSSRCCAAREIAWIRIPTAVVLEFFRGMPVLLMMLFILLVLNDRRILGRRRRAHPLQRRAHRRGAPRRPGRAARAASARRRSASACGRCSRRCSWSSRRRSGRCCRSSSPSSSCS